MKTTTTTLKAMMTMAVLAMSLAPGMLEAQTPWHDKSATTTASGSDKLMIYSSSATKTITVNNLFKGRVITDGLTASGSTANDFSSSTGTFLTSSGANTLNGAVTINAATTPSLTTAAGKTNTGFVQVNGKTSGALKLMPVDAAGQTVTVSLAAQTSGATTLTINDLAGVGHSVMVSTLTTNTTGAANSVTGASNALVFEGSTADANEISVVATDATADRTQTLPDVAGTFEIAQASTAVSLTADNQAVTPGKNTVIQLSSDNATAANRTFTLSATGAVAGQIYVIIGPASNQCEIADTGIQKLSAAWTPGPNDTLTLLFDGTNFNEVSRSDN